MERFVILMTKQELFRFSTEKKHTLSTSFRQEFATDSTSEARDVILQFERILLNSCPTSLVIVRLNVSLTIFVLYDTPRLSLPDKQSGTYY